MDSVVTLDLKPLLSASQGNCTDKATLYQQLVSKAHALQAEIDAALAQISVDDLETLLPQWEEAKRIARPAKDAFDRAMNQRLQHKNNYTSAENKYHDCLIRLSALKNNPPNPNNYPTTDEMAAWKRSVADAQAALDEAHKAVVEAGRDENIFRFELNELEAKFKDAAAKEYELRQKVDALQRKPVALNQEATTSLGLESTTRVIG